MRRVLVGVSLGPRCAVAVRRAHALAERFRASLHIVHVLPRATPALAQNPTVMEEVIRRWTRTEAAVELDSDTVHLESGPPAFRIEEVAKQIRADLVVLGSTARHGLGTTLALTAFMSRAVLVASTERPTGDVIAATDLETNGFPVVKCAVRVAAALGRKVTVVHNVAPRGSTAAGTLADRMRYLEGLAHEFPRLRAANLARSTSNAEAVDEIASARDADIVVLGVRAGRGHTLAGLLDREPSRSVLAIPIVGSSS